VSDGPIEVVADASAVLAWMFEENGAEALGPILEQAGISAVNLAEVLQIADSLGYASDDLDADLAGYGLEFLPFTDAEALAALTVKRAEADAGVNLSLADRCCLATALVRSLPVVTGDRAWSIMSLGIEVRLFR
jgi:PIN domain nuclease of toxin-antitoxin system